MKTRFAAKRLMVLLIAMILGAVFSSCGNRGECKCKGECCKHSYSQQSYANYPDDSDDSYQEWIDNNARWDPSM